MPTQLPDASNRGFDNTDPQKRLSPRSSESSGGNFADSPERTSIDRDVLRDEIDHGKTRDKVNARDPAAVPLGTDEEASATAPRPADDPEDPPVADRGKPEQLQQRPKLPT